MENKKKKSKIQLDAKLKVFLGKPILKNVLKILLTESEQCRSFKSVKNINQLFTIIDENGYAKHPDLIEYIWVIRYVSNKLLDGYIDIELIIEMMKMEFEWSSLKEDICTEYFSKVISLTPMEIRSVNDLITQYLRLGHISQIKDEYIQILEDINLIDVSSFNLLSEKLFEISRHVSDIEVNTAILNSSLTLNTNSLDSLKNTVTTTLNSLVGVSSVYRTGITRLNTLLSPGYMNGRLYCYLGLPASFKSGILLKSALDIKKYNTAEVTMNSGLKPAVLYITMENTFEETIERIWNMIYDVPMTNYSVEEVISMLAKELGIDIDSTKKEIHIDSENTIAQSMLSDNDESLADMITRNDESTFEGSNIELVIQYYAYREISTVDLYTIIQDLKESGLEVCALSLDYIKRIRPSVSTPDNVKIELARIINELKALAVKVNIPVITAHQMNRSAASKIDEAVRKGQGDATKLVGRENVGDAWEIIEGSDFVAVLNTEYKIGTEEKYLTVAVVKRRRIDENDENHKLLYIAHPFSPNNGMRLLDDINNNKILSVQSLVTDIDDVQKVKENSVERLRIYNNKEK